MTFSPGFLARTASARSAVDEVAGDELAGVVDEEAAIGVSVVGDSEVGRLLDDLRRR